ncbi:MAG TPA: L,D-transpeptidase family protein [Candidatus Binatia bacterium]|nr:L,D-transpeptidase family protein [Candidatus Binatia bacterium]
MKHLPCGILLAALLSLAACGNQTRLPEGVKADKILIVKSAHTMTLLTGGNVLKRYKAAIGRGASGPKTRRGDHKTPEGNYIVDAKKSASRFHLALHLSYPNQADRQRARQAAVDPGGDVEIHGIENGLGWIGSLHQTVDWTDGCVAVTDSEMDEIWGAIDVGTSVEIRP